MQYLFAPIEPIGLAIAGSALQLPVHRVFCVGRNYPEHAREMGADPDDQPLCFFSKPPEAIVPGDAPLAYPPATADLHHEVEMVVALGDTLRGGARNIAAGEALEAVFGYAVGVDLTRRDLQAEAKRRSWPWDTAKAFTASAPCSALLPAERIGHPTQARIWLAVNDEIRQDGDIADMACGVAGLIERLSALFTLQPGDLIFTGTPAGVGPLRRGDRVSGGVDGIATLDFAVI